MKNVPCQLVNQPWWPNNIGAIFRPNLILHPPLLNRVYYIQHYGENGTNKVDMLDREIKKKICVKPIFSNEQ